MQIPLLQYPLPGMHMYILFFYIIFHMLCISSSISEVGFFAAINVLHKLLASQSERGTATERFYS